VPISQASISPSGAHETPAAIRRALARFSTLFAQPPGPGSLLDLRDLAALDLGDLDVGDLPNSDAQAVIHDSLAELASREALPGRPDLLVLLGGDNSLTRPALAGLAGEKLGTAGLLTLDAHHDVRGFHAGPTNGTPVRGLVEDGLPGANVVQIGIGAFTNAPAHRAWCDERQVTVVTAAQARAEGVGACVARHLGLLASRCDLLYVDLDVDVLDSAFAPGCPGARPGGLAPHELLEAAHEAGRHPGVVAVDVVEVDALADPGGVTVDIAALCLLHAAAGLMQRPPAGDITIDLP
jgi:arginase family enzyme